MTTPTESLRARIEEWSYEYDCLPYPQEGREAYKKLEQLIESHAQEQSREDRLELIKMLKHEVTTDFNNLALRVKPDRLLYDTVNGLKSKLDEAKAAIQAEGE